MAEEPRRSGRATKGQHKNASSSPAPQPKSGKGSSKGKASKRSTQSEPQEEEGEEDVIRCICGNSDPEDKRAFIGCDTCEVWQHNVCMGITDIGDDIPDHYFCEECQPEDHRETLQAMGRGEKIWEERTRLWQSEKKMSQKRKNKSRGGEDGKPLWLKKDVPAQSAEPAAEPTPPMNQETGSKRKREEETKEDPVSQPKPEAKTAKSNRQEKRRKSSPAGSKLVLEDEADTSIVPIKELPAERKNGALALSKIIAADIEKRTKAGTKLPAGHTPSTLGEYYAVRIEYSLHMNHEAGKDAYKTQFRALTFNLKKNSLLIEQLMNRTLTPDALSTMSSGDMASEDLQKERAAMKEALDRQAVAVQEEGPKYKQDHKGYHLVEESDQTAESAPEPRHFASRPSVSHHSAGGPASSRSPSEQGPLGIDTKQTDPDAARRASSQHFSMDKIWEKTSAQSPSIPNARSVQPHVRRTSSIKAQQPVQGNGAKDDPDVDRMLEDNDEDDKTSSWSPTGHDDIIWRGKIVQIVDEDAPVVNARFVAGRDMAEIGAWHDLLPQRLNIDGRLAINKAEDYLCGLRFSSTSDVAVLALTPYDNADSFNNLFEYFSTRQRYAVIEKDKPELMKDFYIIPLEVGAELPAHISLLKHHAIKTPVEDRMLLAAIVVPRDLESPDQQDSIAFQQPVGTNGHHLPQHMRQSIGGPAETPINLQGSSFSPSNSMPPQSAPTPQAGHGASETPFPPNPYVPPQQVLPGQIAAHPPVPAAQYPATNLRAAQILGELVHAPSAQKVLQHGAALNQEHLLNMKRIFEEDPSTRTDFQAFTTKLYNDERTVQ